MIVVLGGINTDFVVQGARLPTGGEDIKGESFHDFPGGKGANQAIAAARLGARAAMIGRVGGDARGNECLARLRHDGVDVRHVVIDREQPTGAAVIHVDRQGETQSLSAPGANQFVMVEDVRAAAPIITGAQWLIVQLGVPLACVIEAVRIAREAGVRVLLDPAPPTELPAELYSGLDVLKPNAREAEVLTGINVQDRSTARRAVDRLLERGIRLIAIQAGDEGDLLVSRDEEHWLPRKHIRSIDKTGAGDAFSAALAIALCEGRTLEHAGAFASAAAGLATSIIGAQPSLPRRDAVLETLRATGAAGNEPGAR